MTENKRIILNMLATYGRSLYALICGVFTGRWCLMALGEVDYGLMGVVGGLTVFIAFINGWLSGSISRFYAYSVGLTRKAPEQGLEECRRWFSIATMLHTLVPITLIVIGYPIGEWAVREYLTIPPDRIEACVWVFRIACVSCFLGMVTIPYTAMYTAKQYIAELTIYSFITTTLNVCFLYYMVTHPGDWLVKNALWGCLLSLLPTLIICVRAYFIFPECRFKLAHCRSRSHIKQLCNFAGWQFFGAMGHLFRAQVIVILVNKVFGPRVNAAMGVANTLNGHSTSLANALVGAISPAITTACGAGDKKRMQMMAFRTSKFALILSLLFMLPLLLEINNLLTLWLKHPPQYTAGLCAWMIIAYLISVSTDSHGTTILAHGKIASFQLAIGLTCFLTFPLAWLLVKIGFGVYSIGFAIALSTFVHALERVYFARKLNNMSVRYWIFNILTPIVITVLLAGGIGSLTHLYFTPTFWRICLTTGLTEIIFLPLCWFLVLDAEERTFVRNKLSTILTKFKPRR